MAEAFGKFSWSKVQSFLAPVIAEQKPAVEPSQAVDRAGGALSVSPNEQKTAGAASSSSSSSSLLPSQRPPMREKRPSMTHLKEISENNNDPEPDLVIESSPSTPIFDIPKATLILPKSLTSPDEHDPDWEILSDRASVCSAGNGILVPRAGSVRSLASHSSQSQAYTNTLSNGYKISRSPSLSSSTIDTLDLERLGPSGKGVLGVDYVEHIVMPSDTLQGICIAYKVKAANLRRANHFTGHSLHSAPKRLLIPLSKQALRTGFIRVQDTDSKEYKLHYFQAEHPDLTLTEIKAYLELSDWDLKDAIQSANEDREWEREVNGEADGSLKPGQISIHVDQKGANAYNIRLKGTGHSATAKSRAVEGAKRKTTQKKKKVVIHAKPPAIATNAIMAQDAYKAASEHQSFGVELQSFSSSSS